MIKIDPERMQEEGPNGDDAMGAAFVLICIIVTVIMYILN
jgi:hypothetical protein